MTLRTVTRSIETELEPGAILSVLNDPRRIPEWAPVFADSLEPDGPDGWKVRKNDEVFDLQVEVSRASGTVDFLRGMGSGKRGGTYCRVFPRPARGSVVTMTVPVAPGAEPDEVAAVLQQELSALAEISNPRG